MTQKILQPGLALSVVDRYDLTAVIPVAPELWVLGAGLAETALGLALLFGVFTRASAATAIGMFTLTLFALPDDPVLAHVALFGMASAVLITGSGPTRWTVTSSASRVTSSARMRRRRRPTDPAGRLRRNVCQSLPSVRQIRTGNELTGETNIFHRRGRSVAYEQRHVRRRRHHARESA